MAKMFYTLEEAAAKLHVSADQVKEMALSGKLQQFRDRDKLMFKRDQVDTLASGSSADSGSPLPLVDSGDTDAIDLELDSRKPSSSEDARSLTGISVFDSGDASDKSSQTQLTDSNADEEELVLETVGSGSGLLDLTRESDDTSLGAELLDEIYPGSGEGSDAKLDDAPNSSDLFVEPSAEMGSPSAGFEQIAPSAGGSAVRPVSFSAEAFDPTWSGFSAGMFLGAFIVLIIGLIAAISALAGVPVSMTSFFTQTPTNLIVWAIVVPLIASLIFGIVGFFVGKKATA